jgi:type II secretory pathway pseudopilin PulG
MTTKICQTESRRRGAAFTLVEVVFAMAMAGMMFLVLYEGLASGFSIIKLARENTRASQILVEKMETVRLYTWDQINSNSFMLTNFVVAYYPMAGVNGGTLYTGVVTVSDSGLGTSYAEDMKKVTVQLKWVTGKLPRTRQTSTYVSRYGLQNYIYY